MMEYAGAALCENGNVLGITWIENGSVQIRTTVHEVGPNHVVAHKHKWPRFELFIYVGFEVWLQTSYVCSGGMRSAP